MKMENKLMHISIFLLIYLSSSFYALSIKGSINMTILLLTAVITFVMSSNRKLINMKVLFYFLIIIIMSLITLIINSEGIYEYLIFWAGLISAFLISSSIEPANFIRIFVRIMYFLCIFSLITFGIFLIFPNVISFFPEITSSQGLTVNNIFLSVIYPHHYARYNFGFFWEPGAYQTFINLALYFQLFIVREYNIKKTGVFLLTLFTTFSTTGYIAGIMIILLFIIKKKPLRKIDRSKRKKLVFIIILLLGIGLVGFSLLPQTTQFKVFGKLNSLINMDFLTTDGKYRSTTARIDSIIIPIMAWIKSPIFGEGFSNLYEYSISGRKNFLTATPLNWFGLFGLPIGIICNYFIWKWAEIFNSTYVIKILVFLFLTLIAFTEYYNRNAFYLTFIMYGIIINKNYNYKFNRND